MNVRDPDVKKSEPKVSLIRIFEDEEYDPMLRLKSEAVRAKFLEVNKTWLLQNLERYITPEAVDEHLEFLQFQYENVLRMQQSGDFENKYNISDDDESENVKLR